MKTNLRKSLLFFILVSFSFCQETYKGISKNINYKQEMRNFVQKISSYGKEIKPNFLIIPQNGANLVSITGDKSGLPDMNYINSIDGIGQEDLFYGYNDDDQATPTKDNKRLSSFLDMAKKNGKIKILVSDYCFTPSKVDNSYAKNNKKRYTSFAATNRELNIIPTYPSPIYNENTHNITKLQDVKNFLYLLSPDDKYSSKKAFIEAVKKTNYDLIIMDSFYDEEEFTKSEIKELKQKANKASRLVVSYMSIGEAEDYRYYWKKNWKVASPSFIYKENPQWKGNYKVKYWEKQWQDIIFGNQNSYLKKILDLGFDGVYLDIIDAFESFE